VKAVILLGTLKKTALSNTATLCEFFARRLEREGVQCETIRLAEHDIHPGTYSNMGEGDAWPVILEKVLAASVIVFATPIWWANQSSLTQRVIERLDELHDYVMQGNPSGLEGKVAGIIITGDSDGAQAIIGNICSFLNGVGVVVPPYATLSVLWERQAKSQSPTREELLAKYEADYAETADRMIGQLLSYARRKA
jgi:multimeric flavodoxin WrbA